MSLTAGVARAAAIRGDCTAVVDGARRFTWREHADRVARMAAALRALGVGPGDRVSILADSSHAYVEAYHAIPWAGGVLAPVNSRFAPAEMLEMLQDATPRVLLADAAHAELAASLARDMAAPPRVVTIGADLEAMIAAQAPAEDAGRGGGDLACLFYTGGTTGRAKGVMLTHANLVTNALNVSSMLGMTSETVHLHCGPLFHLGAGARVYSTTVFAGTHVVLPRFDAAAVLRTIAEDGVTMAVVVPAMVTALLGVPDFAAHDLSSLRTLSYGAAPMPQALIEALLDRLPHVGLMQSYGQTELSPVATMLSSRDHVAGSALLRSAGQVVPNVELRIADPQDHPLPPGAVGEIQVRGATVMAGYWNRPEETARALAGGWMHTGDAGYLDARGYLFLVDRLKDMIVSGGENVYCAEVENALHDHPAVLECTVFGVPHERWGEAVHAVVVARAGMELSEAGLIAHCRTRIAGYKCPKTIELRTEPLPRSGTGKVQKAALRAPWWQGLARQVN
ncbi:long-chain fatty acid--CoA ligase [Roseomonas eburnea]|uniref:3-methylmercaptopropionyl-CoA ligase n=1 Tax=Neoroseomonas eburnea TaxID=1346889 RepID=A0A9X9X717_9PROT|nr:long-chain-fatty-acid--CoA ligase [Neoroseomonas eburnea]MBR0679503.1 long-chain fatty acid--CoA ligase [Neoroseomonas eburnea]